MSSLFNDNFSNAIYKGFLDKTITAEQGYLPRLLTNKDIPKEKVLSTIINEFDTCMEFCISVAFVTTSGIAVLLNSLIALEKKGVKGRVLVSQYLDFTQPEALKKLKTFKNIELKISTEGNTHSKGYIFKKDNYYNIIIGSSNLTSKALTVNKEWNLKISGLDSSDIVDNVLNEFNTDFEQAISVTDDYISSYEKTYLSKRLVRDKLSTADREEDIVIEPNTMQEVALSNLEKLRAKGENKGLIISATGTGKTYLSAFDVRNFNPKRLLFVVHRLNIANDALNTFKSLIGDIKTYGVFSGDQRNIDADFIFSTVQTISKEENLNRFSKDFFDYIIIDESHRSGGSSYLRLIEYFIPKFLLGMTATPERTDGFDIFSLFNHNIAYEIRLHNAMKENMLSNFHYFGISDLIVNNEEIENVRDFNLITEYERAEKIIANAKLYGCDNGITRGLVFCATNDEASFLAERFNEQGLRSIALSGKSSEHERAIAIEKLESEDNIDKLDYIFTVDIFNEGIDIPKVNQILMIRPTESAIVFVQQLGRGLRKTQNKDFLTVVDFIGNYKNNYLIPIALYGDTTYNKDTLRKLISEGSKNLPGSSTINFDEITKERIYQSISTASMSLLADLKKDYQLLKYRLGRIPLMTDFVEHKSRDPFLFIEHSKSYYNFVKKIEKDQLPDINEQEIRLLELFSREIGNSKRVEESTILKFLIEGKELSIEFLKIHIKEKYGYTVSDDTINSCLINLNFEFVREKKDKKLISVREIYQLDIVRIVDGNWILSSQFKKSLKNNTFREQLLDLINCSIIIFNESFKIENWNDGFVLYRKYSRKDVFRILNAKENPVAQNVGGYLVSPDNTNCPIFVNYHKEDHISESTKYNDEFLNRNEFEWMSKSNRKIESKDVQSILGKNGVIRLPLFIKKSNDEGSDFYYMGEVKPNLDTVEQTHINNDSGGKVSVVKIRFNVFPPVDESIYNYLKDNSSEIQELINEEQESLEIKEVVIKNTIPLYDFYAAAGSFSELQAEKDFQEIEVEEKYAIDDRYFACKVIGESMNRRIPNGAICIFKKIEAGSRNGKIVLVENRDVQDPDFNSAFTVKTYSSQKRVTEDGWEHTEIILKPNSYDDSYRDIIIDSENADSMSIVGEFIKVI